MMELLRKVISVVRNVLGLESPLSDVTSLGLATAQESARAGSETFSTPPLDAVTESALSRSRMRLGEATGQFITAVIARTETIIESKLGDSMNVVVETARSDGRSMIPSPAAPLRPPAVHEVLEAGSAAAAEICAYVTAVEGGLKSQREHLAKDSPYTDDAAGPFFGPDQDVHPSAARVTAEVRRSPVYLWTALVLITLVSFALGFVWIDSARRIAFLVGTGGVVAIMAVASSVVGQELYLRREQDGESGWSTNPFVFYGASLLWSTVVSVGIFTGLGIVSRVQVLWRYLLLGFVFGVVTGLISVVLVHMVVSRSDSSRSDDEVKLASRSRFLHAAKDVAQVEALLEAVGRTHDVVLESVERRVGLLIESYYRENLLQRRNSRTAELLDFVAKEPAGVHADSRKWCCCGLTRTH